MTDVLAATNPEVVALLSHLWSRPVASEVDQWHLLVEHIGELPGGLDTDDGLTLPDDDEAVSTLLDEYERLFVGPGPVPCPPYESYWRNDVSVDIRNSLVGPCTVELQDLYRAMGLFLRPDALELVDHVAIELEAVAYALATPEAAALTGPLITEHLGHFLPRFCRAVASESEVEFYRQLSQSTRSWLDSVTKSLGLTVRPSASAERLVVS